MSTNLPDIRDEFNRFILNYTVGRDLIPDDRDELIRFTAIKLSKCL